MHNINKVTEVTRCKQNKSKMISFIATHTLLTHTKLWISLIIVRFVHRNKIIFVPRIYLKLSHNQKHKPSMILLRSTPSRGSNHRLIDYHCEIRRMILTVTDMYFNSVVTTGTRWIRFHKIQQLANDILNLTFMTVWKLQT